MSGFLTKGMVPRHPLGEKYIANDLALKLSREYYDVGANLYHSFVKDIKMEHKLIVATMNLAFSAEIILKVMQQNQMGSVAKVHSLKELYDDLSIGDRQAIEEVTYNVMNAYSGNTYKRENFYDDLNMISNSFVDARYYFEVDKNKRKKLYYDFTHAFARALFFFSKVIK